MRYLIVFLCFWSFWGYAQSSQGVNSTQLKSATDKEKLKLYLKFSQAYTSNQPDSAVYYANQGMLLAERMKNWSAQAVFLLQLGRINAVHHHDELARRFYNESLNISRRAHDAAGTANAYDELGLLDVKDQNGVSGDKDLNLAMKFYNNSRDTADMIESLQQLGKVYEEKGDIEKALSYNLKALAKYEQLRQKPETYFVLLEQIGNLYLKKGQPKMALTYLQEGVKRSSAQGMKDTEVSLIDEEGEAYQFEGQQGKALSTYKQALQDAQKFKQPEEEAKALIGIASVLKKQNSGKSLGDLENAMKIARKLRQPQLEARIYEAMSGVYRQEKNYKEAMEALEAQHKLLDSLLRADTAKDIAALDSSYALETSYEQIGHLQQTNKREKKELQAGWIILMAVLVIAVLLWLYLQKIKKLNQQLRESNRIKDTLFSVIGHDLKGPASSALQLFEMMETEEFTDAELKSMISELRKQTTASLDLLQSLFEWGRAQLQGIKVNVTDYNPKSIVSRTVTLLSPQAHQKRLKISDNTNPDLKLHTDADHFEFVIRNLLSNAIKFSRPGGEIRLNATAQDKNEVIFSVTDEGVGISEEQQRSFLSGNLKVAFGTAREKGSGLGLLLSKDFIRANHGRIWLESKENEGTTFYVALPAA